MFRQTDGLCDNVFGSEMMALCTLAGRAGGTDEQQVQAVTDNFVHYARACMINDHRSGPWAHFPRTGDGRVYHLGLKTGEVANRIVAVGHPSRALIIEKHLDKTPVPFELTSERGFVTITGRYKGVPISIVSTGMGFPNTDFFVREVRECLSGDMLVVRLGSCGALINIPPGSLVIPKACVGINRNWDYDFINGDPTQQPYFITKQVYKSLEAARPEGKATKIVEGIVNASADSFYSSQGRQTSFPDRNEYLIPHLLEMETFHLFHLAKNYVPLRPHSLGDTEPPVTTEPVSQIVESATGFTQSRVPNQTAASPPRIRAAAAQMTFAARLSETFITPDEVVELERWSGRGILEALIGINLPADRCHEEVGSVWEF
ncbi:purine and uridine phosphorylase [Thelephora ganbajun]|uniref:Purine and uridine phosphorylase n=1 Tax=Thelephora ganbajun TaxID=370292 RepID=A0ACB6ZVI1_THEGA|nr:purine and uridine phosphorylase [Thelephora ganbajun]